MTEEAVGGSLLGKIPKKDLQLISLLFSRCCQGPRACTAPAGISPCLLPAKGVPARFPSSLQVLEEEILLGQTLL